MTPPAQNPCSEHTGPNSQDAVKDDQAKARRAAGKGTPTSFPQKDASGSRTRLKPLCRRLPCRLAPASYQCGMWNSECGVGSCDSSSSALRIPNSTLLVVPPPGVEPGLRPSQSRVPPPHSEDCLESLLPRPSEPRPWLRRTCSPPRNRTSSCSFEGCRASVTLAGHFTQYLDLESNQNLNLRRVQCDPLHDRDRIEGRQPGSHQRDPFCQTGALSHSIHAGNKHRCKESNPARLFWRQSALPGAHR